MPEYWNPPFLLDGRYLTGKLIFQITTSTPIICGYACGVYIPSFAALLLVTGPTPGLRLEPSGGRDPPMQRHYCSYLRLGFPRQRHSPRPKLRRRTTYICSPRRELHCLAQNSDSIVLDVILGTKREEEVGARASN